MFRTRIQLTAVVVAATAAVTAMTIAVAGAMTTAVTTTAAGAVVTTTAVAGTGTESAHVTGTTDGVTQDAVLWAGQGHALVAQPDGAAHQAGPARAAQPGAALLAVARHPAAQQRASEC